MFSIGFARYLPTIPVAPDVAPVTVSPVIKLTVSQAVSTTSITDDGGTLTVGD